MITQSDFDRIRWSYGGLQNLTDQKRAKVYKNDYGIESWELQIIMDVNDYVQAMGLIQLRRILNKIETIEQQIALLK